MVAARAGKSEISSVCEQVEKMAVAVCPTKTRSLRHSCSKIAAKKCEQKKSLKTAIFKDSRTY